MSLELTDKGFIPFTIEGVEKDLDAFAVNNRLADLGRNYQGKPLPDYLQAVVDYLGELGWPNRSHWLAGEFVKAITREVEGLSKNSGGEPKPDSPASTAAESSP